MASLPCGPKNFKKEEKKDIVQIGTVLNQQ